MEIASTLIFLVGVVLLFWSLFPAPMPSGPGRISYTANASVYRGQLGIGASFAIRTNTEDPLALTFGISHAGGKNTAVRAGVAGEF